MRYRAKIYPVENYHIIREKAFWVYRHAFSVAQAGRFIRRAYPYPKFVVEEPIADPIIKESK